MGEKGR